MKKLLRIFFFIILISSIAKAEKKENLTYKYGKKNFVNICMEVWEQIDLIRAVKIADRLKEQLVIAIVDKVTNLYWHYCLIKKQSVENFNCVDLKELIELVEVIEKNFREVFLDAFTDGAITVCFLLNIIKTGLEFPTHIKI